MTVVVQGRTSKKQAAQASEKAKLNEAREHVEEQHQRELDARLLLGAEDLRDLGIKVSRTTLWEMVRRKLFPPPIKLAGKNFWNRREVLTWLDQKMKERAA